MATPQFWLVMTFDVALLVCRDADLYDDLAIYVRKNSGRLGQLVLQVGVILVGPDITNVVDVQLRNGKDLEYKPPTNKEKADVKRELTVSQLIFPHIVDI